MNIQIDYISDYGDLDKERVVIKVLSDTDLGRYLIAVTSELSGGKISSLIRNVLWLPDQPLKTGDRVVLYTKGGSKHNIKNDDGTTTYFFYWGLSSSLTSIKDSGVVIFEAAWTYKKVVPVQQDSEKTNENNVG